MANNYDELVRKLRSHNGWALNETLDQAADAIEELQGKYFMMKKTAEWLAEKVPKWIPVTERLPEEGEIVLACVKCAPDNHLEARQASRWCDEAGGWGIYEGCVTHWMPFPEPPKENA